MLYAWLACTGSGDSAPREPESATSTGHTAAPGHTAEPEPAPPDADPIPATAAAAWAVDFVSGLSMKECSSTYDRLDRAEQSSCPRYFQEGDPWEWGDDCKSPRGSTYSGALIRWTELAWLVDQRLREPILDRFGPTVAPGWTPTPTYSGTARGVGLDGEAQVSYDGEAWAFVGQGWSLEGEDRGLRVRHHTVEGGCTSSSPTGAPWVDAQHLVWMRKTQLWSDTSDASATVVDGSISGVPVGAPFETVSFVELSWLTGVDGACDLEPDGTIEVRDRDGRRWPLVFSSEACDGCADLVRADGTTIAPVCLDFTALRTPFVSAGDR
jgi:hypothetical protein